MPQAKKAQAKKPQVKSSKKTDTHPDSFKSRKVLKVGNKSYVYFSLKAAEKNGLKGIS